MRNLKKYFDALRLLSRVPSQAITDAMHSVLADVRAFAEVKAHNVDCASDADRNLVENLLRAVIDIAKADEVAAEKAGKADKP